MGQSSFPCNQLHDYIIILVPQFGKIELFMRPPINQLLCTLRMNFCAQPIDTKVGRVKRYTWTSASIEQFFEGLLQVHFCVCHNLYRKQHTTVLHTLYVKFFSPSLCTCAKQVAVIMYLSLHCVLVKNITATGVSLLTLLHLAGMA